jgi:hypothetical protein
MRLFSEEVTPTFTNSNLNIITVKDFTEVFFDVYELEINGKKYVTEKVAEYKGLPVISTSVIIDDKEYTGSFVLNKGKFEVLINKESLTYQQNVEDDFSELLAESYKTEEVDDLIFEKRETIIEDIKNAKLSAKRYINKLKQKQIEEATKIHQEKLNEFNSELQEIRQGLVEEFVRVASNVKSDISIANDKESEKLRDYITDRVSILAESLESSLDVKVEELETYINERVNSISTDIVSGVIATEIKSCNNRLDENVDSLFNHINLKLTKLIKEHEVLTTAKVDSIVSVIDDKLSTLDQVSIELNNSIQKSSNKALSRIGNVKTKLEEDIAKNVTVLQHDIDQASTRIKDYYDEKLNSLNEAVSTLSDETKQECIKLISESRDSLLQVISEIKTDVPNIIIEKRDGTGKEINLKKVKLELEKSITTKFSTEVMSLKRMMEMMSGGGSVAQQFANGGVMNGNLTVVGAISASQYLGITGGGVSGDYLPLSGGTVTGALVVGDGFTSYGPEALFTGENFIVETNIVDITAPTITLSGKVGILDTTSAVGSGLSGSALNIAQTWNTNLTPTALSVNVTDLSSNAASLLMDLQVGGVRKLKIDKAGAIYPAGSNTNRITGDTVQIYFGNGSQNFQSFRSTNFVNAANVAFAWCDIDNSASSGTVGLFLFRDANNTLAQRNGLNAQESRIYSTYTNASNYERFFIKTNVGATSATQIGLSAAGTGQNRNLEFVTGGSTKMTISSGGTIIKLGLLGINTGYIVSGTPQRVEIATTTGTHCMVGQLGGFGCLFTDNGMILGAASLPWPTAYITTANVTSLSATGNVTTGGSLSASGTVTSTNGTYSSVQGWNEAVGGYLQFGITGTLLGLSSPNPDNLSPIINGASSNNGVDLGKTTARFRNIYTGGVNASGTVTAGNGAFGNWTLGVDILATTPGGSVQVSGVGSFRFGGAGERIYNSGSAIKIRNAANTLDAALTCSSLSASGTVQTGGYLFANLPSPATQGMRAYITNGAAVPIYMADAAGGGTTVTPVFYNGTNWINA